MTPDDVRRHIRCFIFVYPAHKNPTIFQVFKKSSACRLALQNTFEYSVGITISNAVSVRAAARHSQASFVWFMKVIEKVPSLILFFL
jgi:hypothetical protein